MKALWSRHGREASPHEAFVETCCILAIAEPFPDLGRGYLSFGNSTNLGQGQVGTAQEEDLLIVILHLSGQPAEPYARDIERVTLHIPFVCNHALHIVCPNLCLQVCCVPGKRSDGSVVICAHKYLEHEGSRCQCLERCILFERST